MASQRVLIIDDEAGIAEFVAEVARSCGFEARATTDAGEFRKLVVSWRPDLIVLDLMIPEVDGIELFHFLVDAGLRVPIVILSGADRNILEMAKRLGAARGLDIVATLSKPMRARDLREVLQPLSRRGQ